MLWSYIATAIEALQFELVVIENVGVLLAARCSPPDTKGATEDDPQPRRCNRRATTWLIAVEGVAGGESLAG